MNVLKNGLVLGAIVSIALVSGCASIINSKTQKVNITTSNGSKIVANVDGKTVQAPGIVGLDRSRVEKIITTSDANCAPQTIAPSSVDPIFFGNILIGGLLGSTTDYSTEKMWKYDNTLIISCK
ncbi:adenosine deaminase [Aquirhabdus parva]|uniref:Adenosine deaminase n=1 Tax=Aquirhabdus parva TaxID=2283318 RepID=A0A345P493_9GAMM|nr:adenosine deaminase [Aquirhabdus parva]AXI02102.1 adenosine deaminase [Aquirhabdus parva]